ncbi:hypothetical protein KO495_01210 [Colwellia sp. D2M02]|uniref:hypothetical protein n=1 Tax=Colwellia sp. D2M02 TaxID=2841562 RepID=UPI001C0A3DF6|nr:hypothetical protein [Colwellia sp. D2M02]MBU2891937.1 hypothetical protein [Colwellia sp. D2M02]
MQFTKKILLPLALASVALIPLSLSAQECGVNAEFKNIPQVAKKTYQLSEQVSLYTKQYLSSQSVNSAQLATFVSCQRLVGANYTGAEDEWQRIFDNSLSELATKGFKEVEFVSYKKDAQRYQGELLSKEYVVEASKGATKQTFYMLNILNENKAVLFNIVVSADSSIAKAAEDEFIRFVGTLDIPKQ